jgi:hypothetical protein
MEPNTKPRAAWSRAPDGAGTQVVLSLLETTGQVGKRAWVEKGTPAALPCADNLVDMVVIANLTRMLGPHAKYRIVSQDEGNGKTSLVVKDFDGNVLGPDRAKIVLHHKTKRPRLLFKDPHYGEWIEPECFYAFSSTVFYEENSNILKDEEALP